MSALQPYSASNNLPMTVDDDGEVREVGGSDGAVFEIQARAEIDSQIATARRYPRSLAKFIERAKDFVSISPEVAKSCIYCKPQGTKMVDGRKVPNVVEGMSVRLAEIVASCYGNIQVSSRVISEGHATITAQAACIDLERNNRIIIECTRSIVNAQGRRFSEGMVVMTGNAACAIAYRNAVFKIVPSAFCDPIYQHAQRVAAADSKSLGDRRRDTMAHFAELGVAPGEVFRLVEVEGLEDLTTTHIRTLGGYANAISSGEATIESIFRAPMGEVSGPEAVPAGSKSQRMAVELKGARKKEEPAAAVAPPPAPAPAPAKGREPGEDG